MLNKNNTTVLCPINDLEAHCILAIANEQHIHAIAGPNYWGCTLAQALKGIDISSCKANLLAIELPDINGQGALLLQNHGICLHTLDHHQYAGLNAQHRLSAIEQFAAIFSLQLTKYQQLVAANDKGFIPALLAAGASYEQMHAIRDHEARIRGVVALRKRAFAWFENTLLEPQKSAHLLCFDCPAEFASVMSEVAQFPNEQTYNNALQTAKPLLLRQVVIRYQEQNKTTQIEVLAHNNRTAFANLVEQWPYPQLTSWFGGQTPQFFFGAASKHNNLNNESSFNTLYAQVRQLIK